MNTTKGRISILMHPFFYSSKEKTIVLPLLESR
jgi:hypothetical protein